MDDWPPGSRVRSLYHGTDGDTILAIIRERSMKPSADGTIFFSEFRFESVLMHGADTKRKVTLAVKVSVEIPPDATVEKGATPGVADTLVVRTTAPLSVVVLELYVRQPRGTSVQTIRGTVDILRFLQG
jgi:hypothetical protein